MLAKQDLHTLQEAGIKDIDSLAAAAADFLRSHPIYPINPMNNALSEQEESFLEQGGAAGVGRHHCENATENVTAVAGEYAQMVSAAYTQREAADILGVSTSRIRQRIDAGTLYAINCSLGRVCPRFQFVDHGTLPGLDAVLTATNHNAHPIAVQRFFLSINSDLESSELGCALSPRDWLLTGHAPEPVVLLAQEL